MAESTTSLSPEFDPRSPYYVDRDFEPNENFPKVILSQADDNYFTWKNLFLQFLRRKNKTGFVDGTVEIPEPSSPLYQPWEVCNARVMSWMMSSVSEDLLAHAAFADTARKAWEDLRKIFVPSVGFKINQLRRRILAMRQDGDEVARYFGRMRSAWMELREYDRLPECSCGGCRCEVKKRAEEGREKEECYAFVMGLDEDLGYVRTQIMMMDPLPSLDEAYALVNNEEKLNNMFG
ncbi:unnamed protein product [Brassica napus]|uniref:(rape) hypothetical protein n=1 Tax=Brassica napus TaxID=3708 RepID=A0A816SK73_BRANA|nr:unnamed protein product [Brassica napus]